MNHEILQEAGLTEGESKVYLALLELGSTKTGPLAKKSKVSSSKVYKILDRLEVKGLVGKAKREDVLFFSAMDPNRIIDYLEKREDELKEKKKNISKILPFLQSQRKENFDDSSGAVFEGFNAVTNLFSNIITDLNKGESYSVLGATYGNVKGLREFFHKHHARREEKGIKLKMLANFEEKGKLEKNTLKKSQVKYLPRGVNLNMEIVFYKSKVLIVLWTKTPTAFFLENKEAAKSFQTYFNSFWRPKK